MNISDKQLWDLCQKYGSNARLWARKFAALLPEVNRRGLWKEKFHSIHEFAAQVGGLSARVVDEVLNLDKKLEEKPKLKEQIAAQGWSKVGVAARLPVAEKEAVKMVKSLPKKTLELFAREVDSNEKCLKPTPGSDLQPVTFKLDSETHFQLKKFQQKLERARKEPVPLGIVLKELLKLIPEEPPKQTRKSAGSTTHQIGAQQKRGLESEHRGKCAISGCKNPAREFHHTKRYAKYRTHEGVVPLCHEHHQLAHAGLVANEHDPPTEWRFRTEMFPSSIDRKYLEHLHPR